MRIFLQFFIFICVCLLTVDAAFAREHIQSFVCRAQLNKVGVMQVHESIEVDSLTHFHKPLFRIIDTRTSHNEHSHRFDIKVESVTDGNNKPIRYSVKNHPGAVSIRLDKGHSHKGENGRFIINYEVRGVANFHESHPQLVYDVTGHHWHVTIDNQAGDDFHETWLHLSLHS